MSLSAYYNRTGDPDKALDYARQAVELDPKSDRAWFQKAKADERQGRLTDAVSAERGDRPQLARVLVLLRPGRRVPPARLEHDSQQALESFKRLERDASELEKMRREQRRNAAAPGAGA